MTVGALLALSAGSACMAMSSLDAVLSTLETNGVLADRSLAVKGGIEGILKSIDPDAIITHGADMQGNEASITQAVESVELWPEDIAYLKIRGLIKNSGGEILTRLQSLAHKAGIILDMRGAAGEDLEAVSCLAGLARMREAEPLYVLTDNQGHSLATNTAATVLAVGTPLMVLVDGNTRNASEALVALWRGRPGIMLIGSTTHGEARLREMVMLPDGQAATLATRRLVPLAGESYDKRGVIPDVAVGLIEPEEYRVQFDTNRPARALSAKSEQDRDLMKRVDNDAVLRRATDILLGLRTLGGYGQP